MKIAINGFGRIGRNVFKIAFERPGIEITAVNDLTDAATLAHLLKYDSTYGVYSRNVEVKDQAFLVDGHSVEVLAERNPAALPWADMGVDVVIESTGIFRTAEGAGGGYRDHLSAGAKKVILTVPAKDEIEQTIVMGVNDGTLNPDCTAFSNASCTTNCLAPVAKVLQENFGIETGMMTTVHAYTGDQVLMDAPHGDLRRARSAALNIIPTTTGAASAVGLVIPELKGRLDGMALRVPVPAGSVVDLTAQLSRSVSVDELNEVFRMAAEGPMKGVLQYTEGPVVSSDIKGNSHSSIYDAGAAMVMEGGFVKVLSWYDNEFGYSTRVVDLAEKIA